MKKLHFDIQGMTCASCQAHVTKAVEKLDGTNNVNVSLLTNDMTVEIDESKVDSNKIIKAVENAGYGATLVDDIDINGQENNIISENNINDKQENYSNQIKINNDKLNQDDTAINSIEFKRKKSNKSSVMRNRVQESNDLAIKNMKTRLTISLIFWIPLMIIAMHKMLHISMPIFDGVENSLIFALVQLILTIPILIANKDLLKSGFKSLLKFAPNMDSLVAIGSAASFIYGLISIFKMSYGFGHNNLDLVKNSMNSLYFDSAGTILTLITLGKFFEAKSKGKTGDAITKLINLAPKTSIVIRDGKEETIPTEEILQGDIIVIKTGTSIPVDGVVIEGSSSINQASIAGESIPVEKNVGDEVISGTINENGYMKMRATKVGDETTLAKIVKMVEDASVSKAPIENLADKIAYYFVPAVIGISLITLISWLIAGVGISKAFNFAISVLVISCPCALGLATPVAVMCGTGKGAENGILFKTADSLQALGEIKYAAFDKTGTITEGKPRVTDTIICGISEIEFWKIAYALEKSSEHPLAKAIIEKAEEKFSTDIEEDNKNKGLENNNLNDNNSKTANLENKNILNENNLEKIENKDNSSCYYNKNNFENTIESNLKVSDFEAISGKGVKEKINGEQYFAGNAKLMQENNVDISKYTIRLDELSNQGKTVLFFAKGNNLIGFVAVADTIKNDAKETMQDLKKLGIQTAMITGDNKTVAKEIASQAEISKVYAEVFPEDKEKIISNLQEYKGNSNFSNETSKEFSENKNKAKVAFIGDGINDSPALAKADVGIAIGSGTDIAIESADVILVKNSLTDVANAVKLSRKTLTNIKENLFWAFFYNAICIPLASGVFYKGFGLELNPMIGSLAMSLSSLFVVTNALRLRFVKFNYKEEKVMKEEIKIEGMMCENCVKHVTKALQGIDGVTDVKVSLENKNAIIETSKEISDEKIKNAVDDAGYTATEIIK